MNADQIFVDTSVLVYAHDRDAGAKHKVARMRVASLWDRALLPSVSVQVLQELHVNLVRKRTAPAIAREIVTDYLAWDVIDNDRSLLLEGMRWKEKWKIPYWDALILAAARRAKATEVWSEDLNPDQHYEGIRIVNIFSGMAAD